MSHKVQTIAIVLLGCAAVVGVASYSGTSFSLRTLGQEVRTVFEGACARPVTYAVARYDERFGISEKEFEAALAEAADLWNDAAGKTVIATSTDPDIDVNLVYGERQQVSELGQVINAEQQAYERKKDELDALRDTYTAARKRYLSLRTSFEAASREYESEVAYWNANGGAPPGTYEELNEEREALQRSQARVNAQASEVNSIAQQLNVRIDELNTLAAATNQKVDVFNHAAGEDFDQGNYVSDAEGQRINIFEFTDMTELKRVLAHEFGHALGIRHVENPESIMYSYNIGSTVELSPEDIAALQEKCGLE